MVDRAHLGKPAQRRHEAVGVELPRRRHELEKHLPRVPPLAVDEMPEEARASLLVVGGMPALAGPGASRLADPVAELRRQPALGDVDHLVPAAGLVEAEHGPGRPRRERVLELVAVVEDRRSREDRLERRLREPADPHQGIPHLRLLGRDLSRVVEILEAAAAARRVVVARCLHPLRARLEHLDRESLRVAPLHLRDPRANLVPRQPPTHEHHEPVHPCDAVPAVGERLDLELELVVPGNRRGHPSSLAQVMSRLLRRSVPAAPSTRAQASDTPTAVQ